MARLPNQRWRGTSVPIGFGPWGSFRLAWGRPCVPLGWGNFWVRGVRNNIRPVVVRGVRNNVRPVVVVAAVVVAAVVVVAVVAVVVVVAVVLLLLLLLLLVLVLVPVLVLLLPGALPLPRLGSADYVCICILDLLCLWPLDYCYYFESRLLWLALTSGLGQFLTRRWWQTGLLFIVSKGQAGCNWASGLVEAFRTMTLLQCLQQFLGCGCLVLCQNCFRADSVPTHFNAMLAASALATVRASSVRFPSSASDWWPWQQHTR